MMSRVVAITLVVVLMTSVSCWARQSDPKATPTRPQLADVSPEVLDLVIQDQWDRGNDMFGGRQVVDPASLDWNAITLRDHERQTALSKLLARGAIRSAREYQFAALVYQHSEGTATLQLAHVLAMTAVAKGAEHAKWLAAATLDRYLQALKQPQIFGTQFLRSEGGKWTMEPYDPTAISDSVRADWCVVSVPAQARILKSLQKNGANPNTSLQECK